MAWGGLGFAADAQIVEKELERFGSRPITPEEAFTAWEHLERYDVAQALMAPIELADTAASGQADGDGEVATKREWSQMPAGDVRSELETGLRAILARELRLPEAELELNRPFAEMGVNSVMAMSVRREAEKLLGIELSATMVFNHPTVSSLAGHIASKLLPQESRWR